MTRLAVSTLFISLVGVCLGAYAGSGSGYSPIGLIDARGPEFSALNVDAALAVPGDTITITFSASETLGANPIVRVNSHTAEFISFVGGVYTYTYTVRPSDPSGAATVTVNGADVLGNAGSASSSDILTLDTPELPVRAVPALLALLIVGVAALRRIHRSARNVSVLLLLGALLLMPAALAQDPTVSNVTFAQRAGAAGAEVVVTYDLDTPVDPCYIVVALSKDAGVDGFPYLATSVTGDLDDITTGTGYTIVWNAAADYPGEYLPQAQLRVTAYTGDRDYSAWEAPYPGWILSYSAQCQNHLRQMGIVFKMFANESAGEVWPPLSPEPGKLMCTQDSVYPEYLADPEYLLCPGRAEEDPPPYFDDKHYVYLGYLITCDQDATAFAGAYAARIAAGGDFTTDLPVTTSYGSVMYRLRDGVERFIIEDINDPAEAWRAQSKIPVLMDWPDNHQTGWGGNVLFMDGHAEFVLYGKFPMTDTTIAALRSVANYVPPTEWHMPDPSSPYTPQYSPYIETIDPHDFAKHCANNFKQLGLVCKMFANESPGEVFPPLSTEEGRLMFSEDAVYPEWLTNPGCVLCPGVPTATPAPRVDDRDYVYFGYVLLNDDDVAAFVSAYAAQLAGGGDFSVDLPVTTSYGDTMYRLREGVEGLFTYNPAAAVAAQSSIPVMMEWPDNHEGLSGGTVLYMDGHVEWHDYPGEFPMTAATVNALGALAGRVPKTEWAEPCPAYTPENDPYQLAAECREQCEDLGIVMKMFANESSGEVYPILSNEPGRLMFTEEETYCRYLCNSGTLVCPGPAKVTPEPFFDDQHYVYLGYLVTCDQDVLAFADAYAAQMAGPRDFSGDLPGVVSYGNTIYRLREGIERVLEENSFPIGQHAIPVLIEWPDNHEGMSGGNVLYMDGHVEWQPYPGEFPMTETTIGALDTLATWPRKTAWATKDFTIYNDPHKQALCAYNMNCMGIMAKVFANHSKGEVWPVLSNTPGLLLFDGAEVFPHYLDKVIRLNCPGSQEAFNPPSISDHNYIYLGYLVLNDSDLQVFATAYAAQLAAGGDFTADLPVTTSYGDTMYRLREGIERFFIEDPPGPYCTGQDRIPVLIEWPDNHGAIRGGNVLYMDNHVEWLAYPSEFPMTEAAMTILTTLAGRPPIE